MALSSGSKIEVADVSSAIKTITRSGTTFTYTTLGGSTGTFTQQDNNTTYSAGTGLSLSSNKFSLATVVTAGNAGPTANATPGFGATFTVPYITYDAYGRVTGRTNRTVKIPAAPTSVTTATKATTTPNVRVWDSNYYDLPSGGTWYYYIAPVGGHTAISGSASGGTRVWGEQSGDEKSGGIAIRVA